MKRQIIFIVLCIVFIIIGILNLGNITYLSIFTIPFDILGTFLRWLSSSSTFGNILSIMIFVILSLIPLFLLAYRVYAKRIKKFEFILLPLLTISLLLTIHSFINPHLLYLRLNPLFRNSIETESLYDLEVILTSGIAYIFYLLTLIYLVSLVYVNEQFDSIKTLKILIDITIIAYAFSLLSLSLAELRTNLNISIVLAEDILLYLNYFGFFITIVLSIYLFNLFRNIVVELEENGLQSSVLVSLKRLSVTSFILLVTTVCIQVLSNIYQYIFMGDMLNVKFSFDFPITTIMIVVLLFIFTKHITKIIELKEDHELII